MSDLPNWIDSRIDRNLDNTLTQEHVVETMLDAERPFFSTRQLQARVKPEVSTATVRNRLDELQELDVVATETYPDSVTLYYVDYRESDWPLSPEGKRALSETPRNRLSIGPLAVSDAAGLRMLVVATLGLIVLGGGLGVVGLVLLLDVGAFADLVRSLLVVSTIALLVSLVKLLGAGLVVFVTNRVTG